MRAVQIGDYYLAGDPAQTRRGHSTCDGFRRGGTRSQQRLSGMGWPKSKFVDRGNRKRWVSFNTLRRFASIVDALLFCADYASAHPWSGTVRLTGHDGTQYDLINAVIVRPTRVPNGCSVHLAYTIEYTSAVLVEEEEEP